MIPMRNNKMNTIMFQTSNSIVFCSEKIDIFEYKAKVLFSHGKNERGCSKLNCLIVGSG